MPRARIGSRSWSNVDPAAGSCAARSGYTECGRRPSAAPARRSPRRAAPMRWCRRSSAACRVAEVVGDEERGVATVRAGDLRHPPDLRPVVAVAVGVEEDRQSPPGEVYGSGRNGRNGSYAATAVAPLAIGVPDIAGDSGSDVLGEVEVAVTRCCGPGRARSARCLPGRSRSGRRGSGRGPRSPMRPSAERVEVGDRAEEGAVAVEEQQVEVGR